MLLKCIGDKMTRKILTGTCACPGIVRGRIKNFIEGEKYSKKDIVILNQWVTQDVFKLQNAGALLSSLGGLTCHASILAREFNIPCLVAVKSLEDLPEGTIVEIDAANEEIKLL